MLAIKRIEVTAIHEAGHAYAAKLRGCTVSTVSLDPGMTVFVLRSRFKYFRNGTRLATPEPPPPTDDQPFIFFAGPWAEAKLRQISTGADFSRCLEAATKKNHSDAAQYHQHPNITAWSFELETHWDQIVALAHRLLTTHRFDSYYG